MYIPRRIKESFTKALGQFPALLLTGPRQSGKTTFLRQEFSSIEQYVSLDDPLERSFAVDDPVGFLDRFAGEPVIIDEVQHLPSLLTHIKMRIDNDRSRNGVWILTGSHQFELMKGVTETLAGRIAIFELLPFSFEETEARAKTTLESAIWNGWYPDPYLNPAMRDMWIKSYIRTYIERDVRQLLNIRDLHVFETFVSYMAAIHCQVFNASNISRKTGISQPSVKSWLSLLEASYVVQLVRPYFENFGKRVVKTPKMYFLDSLTVTYLTRQPSAEAAIAGSMGGAFFEGFVVCEVVKLFTSRGLKPDLFFWRSHDGLEVDLVVRTGDQLLPIEIKLTATPTPRHIEPLSRFIDLVGSKADFGLLVCRVKELRKVSRNVTAVSWTELPSQLGAMLDGKQPQ